MKLKKSIIPIVLAIFLIVLAMGPVFAYPPSFAGDLSVDASPTTVHVNDTVTLTVTAENSGLGDWENVMIYAPIPAGLQYVSYVIPSRTIPYNPSMGIWNLQQLNWNGRGHSKELIITTRVLPEAAGKTLRFTSRFTSLIFVDMNGNHTDMVANGWAPTTTRTVNINVLPANDTGLSDGTMGSGNGTGSSSENGILTDNITPTAKADNSTNSTVNTGTIGMQNTGAPLNYMVLAILAVFSGLILPRRK
jgi:uncharacterized repeat protein (TIGR01451 family)